MEETQMEQEFPVTIPVRENALVEIESARAIQEVQASMIIAKRYPRDQNLSYTRIIKACERYTLAKNAQYAYPRGGASVTGPSIRLAEVLALNWGNLEFGIRELSQTEGWSEVEAFAWDLETNTKQVKTFKVPHMRYTKDRGNVSLTDPRDIYEHVANQGARRVRACILGVVPGDIVEAALDQCEKTMKKGNADKPLQDRIRIMLKGFADIGVSQAMVKDRLGHAIDIITEEELLELNKIGRSLIDNMTSREDWFGVGAERDEALAKQFDEAIPKAVDRNQLKIFVAKSVEHFKISEDEVKAGALENLESFLEQFKSWEENAKKDKPEPSDNEDKVRMTLEPEDLMLYDQLKNVRSTSLETRVIQAEALILATSRKFQDWLKNVKWVNVYKGARTYPLDKPEDATTDEIAVPGGENEDTDKEQGDSEQPPLSSEEEIMLSTIEGAKLDIAGRLCVPCPNQNSRAILVSHCNGGCEERVGCPTFEAYDKQ